MTRMSNAHIFTDSRILFAAKPGKRFVFTIKSPTKHFTFKVTAKEDIRAAGKVLFLSVLTGPDNDSAYSYIGILRQDGSIVPTKNSKVDMDAQSVQSLRWMMKHLRAGTLGEHAGYQFLHSGKCCVCGRTLTTPESVSKGVGPTCAQHL